MNGFPVFQQYDPKEFAFFFDPSPLADPPVGLDFAPLWKLDHTRYPLILYCSPVGSLSQIFEVRGCFHLCFLASSFGEPNGDNARPAFWTSRSLPGSDLTAPILNGLEEG